MASFKCNDIDGLVLSMKEIAEIPDDVLNDILMAGAEVVKKAHVKEIKERFNEHTQKLLGSPGVVKATKTSCYVYPLGTHHTYRARKGGTKNARNADVGFVLEFGGHRKKDGTGGIAGTSWMRTANEKCADEMVEAEKKVYDAWLRSKNL